MTGIQVDWYTDAFGVTGIQVDWYTNTLVYRWTGILYWYSLKHFHFVINLFCSYTWVIIYFVYNFAVILITLFI